MGLWDYGSMGLWDIRDNNPHAVSRQPPSVSSPMPIDDFGLQDYVFGLTDSSKRNKARAKAIMDKAMEPGITDEAYIKLILDALEADPRCVEAIWELLGMLEWPEPQYLLGVRSVLEMAAQEIGPVRFARLTGQFGMFPDGDFYLEVRHELAWTLLENNRGIEAVQEWLGMIDLDPVDPYNARYGLVPMHLANNRLDPARTIMTLYAHERETSSVFAWCHVLERFLDNDLPAAAAGLLRARKLNKHFEPLILANKRIETVPDTYQPHTYDEALALYLPLQIAWQAHPKALKWLKSFPGARAN